MNHDENLHSLKDKRSRCQMIQIYVCQFKRKLYPATLSGICSKFVGMCCEQNSFIVTSKTAFTHDDRFANRYANHICIPVCIPITVCKLSYSLFANLSSDRSQESNSLRLQPILVNGQPHVWTSDLVNMLISYNKDIFTIQTIKMNVSVTADRRNLETKGRVLQDPTFSC